MMPGSATSSYMPMQPPPPPGVGPPGVVPSPCVVPPGMVPSADGTSAGPSGYAQAGQYFGMYTPQQMVWPTQENTQSSSWTADAWSGVPVSPYDASATQNSGSFATQSSLPTVTSTITETTLSSPATTVTAEPRCKS